MYKFLKIKNVKHEKGIAIYKGLAISDFVPGSIYYLNDYSFIILATTQKNIPDHKDIIELKEIEYLSIRDEILSKI